MTPRLHQTKSPARNDFRLQQPILRWRRRLDGAANGTFTLIELLVVIAIIAVLAAMLLPTLSMAKNRAQMVIDLNNVHQILLAMHMYANDNKDYLPHPGSQGADGGTWCTGVPFPEPAAGGDVNSYNTYYPLQVKSFKSLNTNGTPMPRANACQFSSYLKNERLLRCTADIPNTLFYKRQQYITSYTWNLAVNAYICGTTPTLRLGLFKTSDILMWETDETRSIWNDECNFPDEGVSGRHGKGATIGRFGGVAERISLRDFYRMANANQPSNGPNDCWCNPLVANGHW
jgi:prepilin-type N-terminal cleavage/methylation domain-containing protein